MAMTVQQATAVVAKVLARGVYGRDDLESFLQGRAVELRDIVKAESPQQSFVRNFVGRGPLEPPSDPLGSAVFKAIQQIMHPSGAAATAADDERAASAEKFGKLVDAIMRNFACGRDEAQMKAIATPEGRAHWDKWKGVAA